MFENMDPQVKYWMFNNWAEDYQDDHTMLENIALLIGSFINPELVKRILGKSGQNYDSTDEEFDATSKAILEEVKQEEARANNNSKRKKRKKVKTN